ncbi:MAG: sigma-70 family RNA polymerase sigma factor [Oscillospiraceae bacterium]|nr:sigma-70 family RNA polymerase sigma factor [Oscillospiraceae bacterium]
MGRAYRKFEALYRLYEKPLYYIAMAILHDHHQAEDAVSDAFLSVMGHLDRLGEPDSPATKQYMITAIRNTAINQYRRNARVRERSMDWNESLLQLPDDSFRLHQKRQEARETLQAMFAPLNDTDRRIVWLHCEEGEPFARIARRLSMKESAVRKRFERARRRMIREKEEEEHDPSVPSGSRKLG